MAAGYGRRMGTEKKKQFLMLGNIPIIVHSLRKFQNSNLINEIVLVVPADEVAFCENRIVNYYDISKVKKIVSGGEKRQDSVFNGLQNVSQETNLVMVHDGVRPFLTSHIIEASIKQAGVKKAVIAAIPVKDTLKKISKERIITEDIDRHSLWRVQTPQVFQKEILTRAYEKAHQDGFYGTDESTLVTRLGIPVHVVAGSELNIKITTKEDMVLAESIFRLHHSYEEF